MSKNIKLAQGYEAIVDDEDYDYLNRIKWHIDTRGKKLYVFTHENGSTVRMSTIICSKRMKAKIPKGSIITYKDGNNLNLRRENLVIVKNGQQRRRNRINNTSGTVGVFYESRRKKWRARIRVNRQDVTLGFFDKKEDAILARKDAEKKYLEKK